ncbi:N-acetylmuramoyl-L-alanine amidase [Alkalihalobacillus sp. AL-G]|uniref:N-acetylmuramoyl-L-alanine amidase n=1 Tax=Alkalihalobacillus sp. AL-G TaxID=2926399 RepID=UPI00272D4DC8|nr:N-acetylmuramoyl-L-alanine amidase [Alkalihalobacillus sp. AL-G]WLD94174.1 N-acetylmuramoyl-L-alanine amidase [Alkalihalobacillus sp. AL-G]
MKTIVLDPGHGGRDTGATYRQYREKDFNLEVSLQVRKYLLNDYSANVLMTRTTDKTLTLGERTTFANEKNADFFCSIHHNAAGGRGFESFIYNGSVPESTKRIQDIVHQEIVYTVNRYNVVNRGQKRANFYVLRNTEMDALLLEILFIDNEQDLKLMLNDQFVDDVANATAQGIAKALSLPRKKTPEPPAGKVLYKVIAGSFKEKKNAEERAAFLKEKGIEPYIYSVTIDGSLFYRVQAGAYADKENAEDQERKVEQLGIKDAFIVTEGTSEPSEPPTPEPVKGYTILGPTLIQPENLNLFVKKVNPNAPDLGALYDELSRVYGIRGDVAFAQAVHETNYFRFTGVVEPGQNNYAGIGATGPNENGASFATPKEGVLAHLQHLFAYASTEQPPDEFDIVDPRFSLVNRGSAKSWTQLNGKWAVPGTTYGQQILALYEKMIDFEINQVNEHLDRLEKAKQQI